MSIIKGCFRPCPIARPRFLTVSSLLCAFGLAWLAGTAPAGQGTRTAANPVPAPELVGDTWLNVPQKGKPSLASRKGKVTIVHFWTFGCVNCQRNLPYYREWQKRFSGRDLEIIGVHTPETAEEKDSSNVARKVKEYGISYPILIDKDSMNWKCWQQRYWPAVYLIDKQGRARFAWEGELEYQNSGGNLKMIGLIESLLRE